MRKAKVTATIFGGVSSAIFVGLFAVYAKSPVLSSVSPKNNVEKVYEVAGDDAAEVIAVTTLRTTAVTTASKNSTTTKAITTEANTTATAVSTTAKTTATSGTVTATATTTVQTVEAEPATEAPEEIIVESSEEAEDFYEEVIEYEYEVPEEIDYADPPEEYIEYVEPATEAEVVYVEETTAASLPISESDYIILCNAVAHEAGSGWIDINDKAKVVEVIMNRVNSPLYPNTVTGVLTQAYQFSGASSYVYLGTYSSAVNDAVISAVDLYFADPSAFAHGYISFYGDGYRNYFS